MFSSHLRFKEDFTEESGFDVLSVSLKMTIDDLATANDFVILDVNKKRKMFYEYLENQINQLIDIFTEQIQKFDQRSFIIFNVALNLFVFNLEFKLKGKVQEPLNFSNFREKIKSLVSKYLSYLSSELIKKIGTLFTSDQWKRIMYKDISEFFQFSKLIHKTPFMLQVFLPYLNSSMKYDEKTEKSIINSYYEFFDILMNSAKLTPNQANSSINSYINNEMLRSDSNDKEELSEIKPLISVKIAELPFNSLGIRFINANELIISRSIDTNKDLIFSTSTYSLMTYIIDIFSFGFLAEDCITEVYRHIFYILDYYTITCINVFSERSFISTLFDDSVYNLETLAKKPEKIDAFLDAIQHQHKHLSIKQYLVESLSGLKIFLNADIEFPSGLGPTGSNEKGLRGSIGTLNASSKLAVLNPDIVFNPKNIYNLVVEKLVAYESIRTLKKMITRLSYLNAETYDEHNQIIATKLAKYKSMTSQLKSFVYLPVAANVMKTSQYILDKILNFKWEADENNTKFTEGNMWVDDLYLEICSQYEKLDLFSNSTLSYKSKFKFIEILFTYMLEQIMGTFSNVKKCNSTGRSLMLKDIKFLKQKIGDNFNIKKLSQIFSKIELYINAWYYNDDELLKYIKGTDVHPKMLAGIMNTGTYFTKLNKSAKKDCLKKFEQAYYEQIDNLRLIYYS